MNAKSREESLTLEILETIDGQSDVTQRHLADRLGVALGLANSYLKRCVRKGLIKIEQAPANRYLYYLTPTGFAEKSRLTAEYLSSSFDFYRRAGTSCAKVFSLCRERNCRTVVLYGISELAEIASLRAREQGVTIVALIAENSRRRDFIGIPVHASLDMVNGYDACVITGLNSARELYEHASEFMAKDRIYIPDILGIKNKQ